MNRRESLKQAGKALVAVLFGGLLVRKTSASSAFATHTQRTVHLEQKSFVTASVTKADLEREPLTQLAEATTQLNSALKTWMEQCAKDRSPLWKLNVVFVDTYDPDWNPNCTLARWEMTGRRWHASAWNYCPDFDGAGYSLRIEPSK